MAAFGMDIIGLEEGWELIRKGIAKLMRILEGYPEPKFTAEEHLLMYTAIYNMCTLNRSHDYAKELYARYKDSFIEYLSSAVLPSLREKHDEFMLREFVTRWSINKVMARWLAHFFSYLDRYFITQGSLRTLKEVGLSCFRDLIFNQIKENLRDAVIALIDQERQGGQIDRALLKDVLNIFIEIGLGSMNYYENDFEETMLKCTAAYYSRKASDWILTDSCPVYMLKAEECLKHEKDRVSHYLHSSSKPKLLEIVQRELLSSYAKEVLKKESFGCHNFFRDDKLDDLSRMYRLFSRIPHSLDPVSQVFKQHAISEGTTIVKQAEDVASSEMAEDVVVLQEQVFVRKLIEHFDKYLAYVSDCFQNDHRFHKALKEAVEVLCSKVFPDRSSAEVLVSFCDNLLRKGGSWKLRDEAIEEILEKVARFLSSVSDEDIFAELYRKKLGRKLLFDRSANYDHERSILTKLKHHCRQQFSRMEGMRKSDKV